MKIIDAQLHGPGPWLDWRTRDEDVQHDALTEVTLGWLDSLGVQGAILFAEEAWAADASAKFPARFAFVPHFHLGHGDVDAEVQKWRSRRDEGALALRIVLGYPTTGEEIEVFRTGAYDAVLASCERWQLPVFLFTTRWPDVAETIAQRHPELLLIVDHLGLAQPPMDTRESPPFKSIDQVLALAKYPNVAVKFCGAPALSEEPYPYNDLWPYVGRFIDAFGADRLMWASDISRFNGRIGYFQIPNTESYPGKHTYAEALHFIRDSDRLSVEEKELILGGTVKKLLDWPNS